jgi:uncharacterized membrane protein
MLSLYEKGTRFNILAAVRMNITVFWHITSCSSVENIYQATVHHFPEIYRHILKE